MNWTLWITTATGFLLTIDAAHAFVCNPDKYLCNTGTETAYTLTPSETTMVRQCNDPRYEIFFPRNGQPTPPGWATVYEKWQHDWQARLKSVRMPVRQCIFEITGDHPRNDPNASCVADVIDLCDRLTPGTIPGLK